MLKRWSYLLLGAIGLCLFLTACKTNKKTGKPGALTQGWHDMNSRYNGYYNANLRVVESFEKLDESYQDNYRQVLPMFPHAAVDNAQAVQGRLDEAIKKSTIGIEVHRISRWTDDHYLLVGKSEYLKKDYEKALQTFRYTAIKYNPNKPKGQMSKAEKIDAKKEEAKEKEQTKKEKEKEKEQIAKDKKKALKEKQKAREKALKEKQKAAKQKKKGTGKKVTSGKSTGKERKVKSAAEAWDDAEKSAEEILKKEQAEKEEAARKEAAANLENEKEAAESAALGALDPQTGEKRTKRYFLKHRPAYHQALLWQARTHIELKEYEQAERCLSKIAADPNASKKIRPYISLVMAYRFLKEKNNEAAIPYLERGIETLRNKKEKTRFNYILAQLYQQKGEREMAATAFQKVVKGRPNFEMEFNARLNLSINGEASSAKAALALERMLREDKNEEYRDQIYFGLAQIAVEEPNTDMAIEYLKQSLKANRGNNAQKAEAYYLAATIYDGKEDYIRAVKYYDSTLTVLAKTEDRYPVVEKRKSDLADLATNLEIIEVSDSLLHVADMSADDQKALAKKIKKDQDAQAAAGKDATTAAAGVPPTTAAMRSEFPLYNDKLKSKGQRDFVQRWGNRSLVDKWRLSSVVEEATSAVAGADNSSSGVFLTQAEVDNILKDVPKNAEERKVMEAKIADAMFLSGKLYRDKLADNKKAIAMLDKLMKRFPDNKNAEEALFYLWLLSKDTKNANAAASYKQQILQKFPNGKIAKAVSDDAYVGAEHARELKIDTYYKNAYKDYQADNFNGAYVKLVAADSLFGKENPYQAKFDLLKAICIGAVKGKEAYIAALKVVKTSYAEKEEGKKAAEMLIALGEADDTKPKNNLKPGDEKKVDVGIYKYDENAVHFVIIALKSKDAKLDDVKKTISDYNTSNHNLDKLKTSNILLGDNVSSITIRKFQGVAKAVAYVREVNGKSTFITPGVEYDIFGISQDNYTQLVKSRDLATYLTWYSENYK